MKNERILSIDIFRGLTIFLMIFVNDLAGVSNIPGWLKHAPVEVDGMTFVDVIFPAFLFIVGMVMPFAIETRLAKDAGRLGLWKHVFFRTLGLLILGFYMVNIEEMNAAINLIPKKVWVVSFYVAVILIWNSYPKTEQKSKQLLFKGLKVLGVCTLIALYFLYRKGSEDQPVGMTPSWWGILGLIGWAYLIAVLLFMASKRKLVATTGIFSALLIFLLLLRSDSVVMPSWLSWFKAQTGHIAHTLITLSGIICAQFLIRGGITQESSTKIRNILLFGVILMVIGYFVQSFGGISKNNATPSWALYSAAICCFVFPLIYWLVDLKGQKRWADFLIPAGENPLLAYLLPFLFYGIAGYVLFVGPLGVGFIGILKAVLFTLFMLWLAAGFVKDGIRLRL